MFSHVSYVLTVIIIFVSLLYRTGTFRKHRQAQTLNFDDADDGDHGEEKETVQGNL